MKQQYLKIIGYVAFSIGFLVFGYLSLQALDWYGIDIPGIEYTESVPSISWMIEQVESGKMRGPEAESFKDQISAIKKRKLLFSIAGFLACAAGLTLLKIRKRAADTST